MHVADMHDMLGHIMHDGGMHEMLGTCHACLHHE